MTDDRSREKKKVLTIAGVAVVVTVVLNLMGSGQAGNDVLAMIVIVPALAALVFGVRAAVMYWQDWYQS